MSEGPEGPGDEERELPPGYYLDPATGAWLTLPWPAVPLAVPSLAPGILRWCTGADIGEPRLLHHLTGEPWRFTRGQLRFLHLWYSVRDDGRWVWRSGVKRGAKGTGKDPFGAAVALIEAAGPSRFAGWDSAGQPAGARHRLALVQIAANSEAQAGDLLRVANAMVSSALAEEIGWDPGILRSRCHDGSRIELLTSSERSSEGDPATCIILNEALALDTPLPTPAGWTTVGDVQLGDEVLGADGQPARVTKVTEISAARTCFRLTFSDKSTMVADAGHLWSARPAMTRSVGLWTTEGMWRDGRRFRVPVPEPVDLPEQRLPVDPYVLGVWLGDACRGSVAFTCHADDVAWWLEEIPKHGYPIAVRRIVSGGVELTFAGEAHSWANRGTGLRAQLVELGIYELKAFPGEYLRASLTQRLALLQGLVDTDGHVTREGRVIFVNTNEDIAMGVAELARSLGHTVQVSRHEDHRKESYLPTWRVQWQGCTEFPSARMPRRAERLRPRTVSGAFKTITVIEEVDPVPVRCIAVDNADHLFLAGQWTVTHNSHHMTHTSGGQALAAVARRNVGKSPGGQARVLELTNAHLPGEESVAEGSFDAWQLQAAGSTRRTDILYDSREAPPHLSPHDEDQLMEGIAAAYADAPWIDPERIRDEAQDPRITVADSVRFYFNALPTNEQAWVDPRKFDAGARADISVADKEAVAMFLDCSKSTDATALVACRISDGHVMALGGWQRPHGDRGKGWLAPRNEVDAQVRMAFEAWDVQWFGVDPSPARDDETEAQYWAPMVDAWHRDFREKVLLWATPGSKEGTKGNAVSFDMRLSSSGGLERNKLFTEAAEQTAADIDELQTLTHDGDPMLRMHVHNARRRPNQWGITLGKKSRDSSLLVDLAVAMVGARLGRRLVLNSGRSRERKRSGVIW